jgi:hypothetical protein
MPVTEAVLGDDLLVGDFTVGGEGEEPAGNLWEMTYGGLTFGGLDRLATYQLQELPEGLGTPDYISGDVQRSLEQGEYAGVDLSPGRNITVKQVIQAATEPQLDAARQAFAAILTPKGSAEYPLTLQLASGLFTCYARPRKHAPPIDVNTIVGKGTIVATMFHATDPRWYTAPQTAVTGLAVPGGIAPPVTPPVTIKGGSGGLVEVVNTGPMYTYATLEFTGPCTVPKAANLSLPGAPAVAFNVTLNAGDTLTVEMGYRSVVLTSAGSTAGSSRRSSIMPGSVWWPLPGATVQPDGTLTPSTSVIQFTSEDTSRVAGTLTVSCASAYMGI